VTEVKSSIHGDKRDMFPSQERKKNQKEKKKREKERKTEERADRDSFI